MRGPLFSLYTSLYDGYLYILYTHRKYRAYWPCYYGNLSRLYAYGIEKELTYEISDKRIADNKSRG